MFDGLDDVALDELLVFLAHGHEGAFHLAEHSFELSVDGGYLLVSLVLLPLQFVEALGETVVSSDFEGLQLLAIGLDGRHVAQGLLESCDPIF
jgi:hypothetical protein